MKLVSEYRRTCKACSKQWHSLVDREEVILLRKRANAAQGAVGCCSPNTSATSIGTGQLIDSELQRLRQCPECQSANFDEEIIDYDSNVPIPDAEISEPVSEASTGDEELPVEELGESVEARVVPAASSKWGLGKVLAILLWVLFGALLVTVAINSANSTTKANEQATTTVLGSGSDTESEDSTDVKKSSSTSSGTSSTSGSMPSGWSTDEREIWTLLESIYPEISSLNSAGKAAFIESTHLVCQAYSEGYSRLEILSVIDGGNLPQGLMDDMMTLSVATFCPEYTDIQLQ